MKCRDCGQRTKVLSTAAYSEKGDCKVLRERHCTSCDVRFASIEIRESDPSKKRHRHE